MSLWPLTETYGFWRIPRCWQGLLRAWGRSSKASNRPLRHESSTTMVSWKSRSIILVQTFVIILGDRARADALCKSQKIPVRIENHELPPCIHAVGLPNFGSVKVTERLDPFREKPVIYVLNVIDQELKIYAPTNGSFQRFGISWLPTPCSWKTCLARSIPIMLTFPTDASSIAVSQHRHLGTSMPSRGVHPIGFIRQAGRPPEHAVAHVRQDHALWHDH